MKKLWNEFKTFAFKGSALDLAIGMMIGSAFTKIVNSLVSDLFTPLLSLLTNKVSFASLGIPLGEGEDAAVFAYGNFIQSVIDFLLVALCIFLFVKLITRFRKKEAPAKAPRLCPYCRQPIADDATRCPHCTSPLEEKENP